MTHPQFTNPSWFNSVLAATSVCVLMSAPVSAAPFFFSTGDPDGRIGTASRPASAGKIEIESADDFVLSQTTSIDHATFTGLLPSDATINQVRLEIYRVFPKDSADPPSGHVLTRVNSPSDVAFEDTDTRGLTFIDNTLSLSFTAANTVVNGINPKPNQTTAGEGPATGREVLFSVKLATPFVLPADHYFFIPQVELANGEFLWLSAPKPIVAPGTPFTPDLQSWIRNEALAPDWSRIGTDVVGGAPPPTFNGAFSLSGQTVPLPGSLMFLGSALTGLIAARRRIA